MIPLPEDVSQSLLRGVGAFLRATPAPELPPQVRRFRGFRPAALVPHREKILALLDDEAVRRMILLWLDEDKPSLRKDDAANLRFAVEQPAGWEESLAARSRSVEGQGGRQEAATAREKERLARSLAREKERSRRARNELKGAREAADQQVAAERARADTAESKIRELTSALEKALTEADAAREGGKTERDRAERRLRRARRDAEKASAETASLKTEAKELRSRVRKLEREIQQRSAKAGTGAANKTTPAQTGSTQTAHRGPRKPLKPPKGLLADALETLEGWLGRDDVRLVVDGYNVTKAAGGYGELELEEQRERLVREVSTLTTRKRVQGMIVFDGSDVPPGARRTRKGTVKVVFSKHGETADDRIVTLLEDLPPVPVVLATNDRELQERGRALGATIATSNQLLALLR